VLSSTWDVSSRGMAVVDTNTVRYHTQRIRVVGLDTPELNGHCEEETLLARWARHRLEELASSQRRPSRSRSTAPHATSSMRT
jgi:endonuclease YncB( thermonuclease family)